jgi:hypothetical protein
LSEDQKKPVISKMPGPLPGLGGKLGGNPLPGLGGTPGVGPLPGLGARTSAAPLPGMRPQAGLPGMQPQAGLPGMRPQAGLPGMQPQAGLPGMQPQAGLPGMKPAMGLPGMQSQNVVPPFMQQPQYVEPAPEPVIQTDPHDPFGKAASGSPQQVDQFIMPSVADMYADNAPAPASINKKKVIINFAILSAVGIVLGVIFGTAASSCRARNVGIRDAMIVDYELKDNAKLFNEMQSAIDAAVAKASRNEVDEAHIAFLTEKIFGSPVKPGIINERDFKKFGSDCMKWMAEYTTSWDRLYALIREHRMESRNDMDALKASKNALDYGTIFKFDNDGNLSASLGVLGALVGNQMQVQSDTGSRPLKRELYSVQAEEKGLLKDKQPSDYVVKVGDASKNGLLKNSSEPHFVRYVKRLKTIADLIKSMAEMQKNLLAKFDEFSRESAAPFVKPNPTKAFEQYLERSKGGGEGEAAAEPAKK